LNGSVYPCRFVAIYKEKIWGGRALERLFGRTLPPGARVGESWELADLPQGVSVVANGPRRGTPLTDLTRDWGRSLLGGARAAGDGRFPLLLKLLDANDILSLQVHPDQRAVREIGPAAALKTECWYVLESRGGYVYKGTAPDVTPRQFRRAVETALVEQIERVVRRIDVAAGDFHYLPAGTVHALGPGVVVAEVQTPSDTTYRVTDWGRGRETHLDRAMQCIRFGLTGEPPPGAQDERLLETSFFAVYRRTGARGGQVKLTEGRCAAAMVLAGRGAVRHGGSTEAEVPFRAGDTLLLPAGLTRCEIVAADDCAWLEVTLPE